MKRRFQMLGSIAVAGVLVGGIWMAKLRTTPEATVEGAVARVKERAFKRIFVMVFENTASVEALQQPFLQKLTKMGAYFSNFHGTTHPSLPNYISMIAGSPMGVVDDGVHNLEGRHLGDLLEAKGLTWKVYAENLPAPCSRQNRGLYVQKHVPFLSFANITSNPERCAKIVDAKEFTMDLENGRLPNYAMYIPNQINDGHDTGVKDADLWLRENFSQFLSDPRFTQDTLFILTFDEDNYSHPENLIYVVFYNPERIQAGVVNRERHSHASVLKFIEDNFELGHLGRADASAPPITGIFKPAN